MINTRCYARAEVIRIESKMFLFLKKKSSTVGDTKWEQNMPLCHIDYFALNLLKKQPVQKEHSDSPLSPWKQEINLPCETYPPCTKRIENILITRDMKFRANEAIWTKLVTSSLIYYPKLKLLCLVNSSQIFCFFV